MVIYCGSEAGPLGCICGKQKAELVCGKTEGSAVGGRRIGDIVRRADRNGLE